MPTVITGASGHLGGLVVDQLLATGTPPAQIVATGRDIDKPTDLAQDGVTVRRADFADPSTLENAFAGADVMLLVSTTTVGDRFDNARKAIEAAARAGVPQIVYTGIVNASTAQMTLAAPPRLLLTRTRERRAFPPPEPFVAAHPALGEADGSVPTMIDIVDRQAVRQSPLGLGIGRIALSFVGAVGDLTSIDRYSKPPSATRCLCDAARPSKATCSSFWCHREQTTNGRPRSAPTSRKDRAKPQKAA